MEVTVKVTKEAYELGDAVALLLKDIKAQLGDGWQPVGDSIAISTAVLKDLLPGLAGAEKLPAETTDAAFPVTCALVGAKLLAAVRG